MECRHFLIHPQCDMFSKRRQLTSYIIVWLLKSIKRIGHEYYSCCRSSFICSVVFAGSWVWGESGCYLIPWGLCICLFVLFRSRTAHSSHAKRSWGEWKSFHVLSAGCCICTWNVILYRGCTTIDRAGFVQECDADSRKKNHVPSIQHMGTLGSVVA